MNALLEARTLLRQLGLSGGCFNRDLLLERLESRLGIVIDAVPDTRLPAGGISGACITTNGSHVVFYPADASDRQQLAVLCHECAHLLLGHRCRSVDNVLETSELPSPDDELDAEAFGAALVQLARRPDRLRMLLEGSGHHRQLTARASARLSLGSYYDARGRVGW